MKINESNEYNFLHPSPNFVNNMTQNIKQKHSEKLSSDACPNRAWLFALASRNNLLAKLGRGGDFYNRYAH